MNLVVALALTIQAPVWLVSPPAATVGDTVRLTRRIDAGPEVTAVALSVDPTDSYDPLSPPITAYSEGAVVVRYQLAFFRTGRFQVVVPDLELTYPDGRVNIIAGDTAWVRVVSVLPPENFLPPPQASAAPIPRTQRSFTPAIILGAITASGLLFWAVWRRRTSPRPAWNGTEGGEFEIPLQKWIMAGELKLVVSAIYDRIRDAIETELPEAGRQLSTEECLDVLNAVRPEWPTRDIGEVLRSLDRAQYAPAVPNDIALLADQADHLVSAIRQPVAEEAV